MKSDQPNTKSLPRTRINIFNQNNQPLQQSPPKPRVKSSLFQEDCNVTPPPRKVKLSPTLVSKVFTPEKQENPSFRGIKTYPPPEPRHIEDSKHKLSPYKKNDHPSACFYHNLPNTQEQKNTVRKDNVNNLNYAKEKKFRNDQSDILNTNKPLLNRQHVKSDLISSDFSWQTPNYKGEPKTVVNEKAQFDKQYYKNRRLDEYLSSAIPSQSLEKQYLSHSQSPKPTQERSPNQRYSNLFDRPLGTPDIVGGKVKTISPSMDWTNYDSIRNKQDYNDNQKVAQKKTNQKFERSKLSNQHIYCTTTNKSLHGQGRREKDDIKQVPKITSGNTSVYRPQSSAQQYKGIYKWKNNYKKK